ncbi:tRNA threonylcarbamoyladenosine dehydratase [Paracidovorax valerianellae]|uniref:tRNA A37 threonylcarbamoyladenosine dehydratase n=1 Tax=Paracidovorax valerianellae TaxID=187868 RepID=A0A1G6ZZR1_9BURK|nr:tRNA threonylcarbamoyladenosine dehydratase [Paracidovorax valerianellae]MDA8443796.1 tRNA threonylcarbamoyladenosine dehydratase [Paracidovorax valerianellae]SDE08020.1 tRNA A37 threonylcarbamoyladenosine dehydratase [Paracidovorax valerianellae]
MFVESHAITPPAEVDEIADLQRRFSGLDRLYGVEGASRIRNAHVAVVGIGGVGSWTAEALARSGVRRLTLIDLDNVAESNINRQIHALSTTVGQAKVDAMRDRIALINPECQVTCIEEFADSDNWPGLLPQGVDAVVDACDQVKTKAVMADWAVRGKHLLVTVGAAGGKRLAHKVDIDDLSNTTHDPLLAQVRYRLRKHYGAPKEGRRIGVPCVFSREAVAPPHSSCDISGDGDGSLNCHGYGSVVAVTATFGQCAAGWILDALATKSASLNRSEKKL